MKILLDKEFKEIKETIEMYKDNYNKALEDYYKCDKFAKNIHNKYTEKMEENFFLENKINKAIEYIGNGNIGIPKKTREMFIKILKGEE
jgi:hypothetical protein